MKQLPKYALLTNSEIPGIKVISLERPYIIASVFDYRRDDERVGERLEDLAQSRYPIAKIPGYTIFLTLYTSLEPCNNPELQQAVLEEMAQYFLDDKIGHKPGQFMKSEETGRDEKKFIQAGQRNKVLRERKNRIKKD